MYCVFTIQRIRDIFVAVLYKSMFYLLFTYLRLKDKDLWSDDQDKDLKYKDKDL